jgi:excisionase family DNA binding protein
MSRFSTLKEASREIKCSVPTLRAWTKHGMPVHHFGWLVRVDLEEVLAWLETYKPQRRLALEQARVATSTERTTPAALKHVPSPRPLSQKR